MLTFTHAQRPASLLLPAVIVDQRPRQVSQPAANAALQGHNSAMSISAATGSGFGTADKRGPVTGVIAAEPMAVLTAKGVPPRGCSG